MKKSKKNFKKKQEAKRGLEKEKIKEELKKLKIKIPGKEEEKPEESLEREIKETEEIIEDSEFHEFFQPSNRSFISLLNRTETPAENLEENIASVPVQKTEQTPISYSPEDYPQGDRKYKDTGAVLKRIEMSGELPRHELINQFEKQSQRNPWNPWDTENQKAEFEILEEKRTMPFERLERKYKEFKPR